MYAVLLSAAASIIPSPAEVNQAEDLIRHPELAAPDLPPLRGRLAAHAAGQRLGVLAPHIGLYWEPFNDDVPVGYESLRWMFRDVQDCPPLADAARLPPAQWCTAASGWNDRLAARWRESARWEHDRAALFLAAAAEADWHSRFWWAAGWATADGPDCSPHARRTSLRTLRDMMGAEAWDRGELPDAGPFGRLSPR